jgi:hypothetical protein
VNNEAICITQEHKRIAIEKLKAKESARAGEQSNTVNPGDPLQGIAPEEKQQDCSQIYLPQDSASATSSMSLRAP